MRSAIVLAAALYACGCSSAQQAKVVAASDACAPHQIRVVEESMTSMLLDVCGSQELWMLSMNGRYERVDEQPTELSRR